MKSVIIPFYHRNLALIIYRPSYTGNFHFTEVFEVMFKKFSQTILRKERVSKQNIDSDCFPWIGILQHKQLLINLIILPRLQLNYC